MSDAQTIVLTRCRPALINLCLAVDARHSGYAPTGVAIQVRGTCAVILTGFGVAEVYLRSAAFICKYMQLGQHFYRRGQSHIRLSLPCGIHAYVVTN